MFVSLNSGNSLYNFSSTSAKVFDAIQGKEKLSFFLPVDMKLTHIISLKLTLFGDFGVLFNCILRLFNSLSFWLIILIKLFIVSLWIFNWFCNSLIFNFCCSINSLALDNSFFKFLISIIWLKKLPWLLFELL